MKFHVICYTFATLLLRVATNPFIKFNMKYPTVRFVFNRRKSKDPKVPATVEIEVYHDARRKYISTGVKVLPSQWDAEKHVVRHPDSATINLRLDAARKPIDAYLTSLIAAGEPFSFDDFAEVLRPRQSRPSGSFRDFVAARIEERTDIEDSTRKSHRVLNFILDEYGKIDSFTSLTPASIKAFDQWLHARKTPDGASCLSQTTIAKYHKIMKCYINDAISRDLIAKNPYAGFKVAQGKPRKRRYLTEEELDRIERCETKLDAVSRARDLFIFQCYTGLAYADLERFDPANVIKRGDRMIFVGTRQKTEELFYVVLLSPAVRILEKYDYRLPVTSNQKYNAALKKLGKVIGRTLTSHMGRHTAATMFLNKGMSLELVAKVLGHTNTKQTAEYAKLVNKSVENAFDRLQRELDAK